MSSHRVEYRPSFQAMAESLAEVLIVADEKGNLRYVSPTIEPLLGHPSEELLDRNGFEFVHPEDRERLREDFQVLVEGGELPGPSLIRLVHRSQEIRHVEASGRNLLDDPEVEGVVVTLRDVTDRVEMEERLREAQKLEAVGRLAGGIAHDFNNILTAIKGHAELLLTDLPPGHPLRPDVEEIRSGARRAAELTESLLSFSRRRVLIPKALDLAEVVRSQESEIRRLLEPGIELELELSQECRVQADPRPISQIILHLVENATDAMPNGGTLRIRVHRIQHPEGPRVSLEISDTGHGMGEEVRNRIFEPYFTTREQGDRSGLGLSMVFGVVKQSRGSVDVTSEPGVGTNVHLRFPVADG